MAYRIQYSDGTLTQQAWSSEKRAKEIIRLMKHYDGKLIKIDLRKAPAPNKMWIPSVSKNSGVYQIRSTKAEIRRRTR